MVLCGCRLFFFNDTATTEIYTLSLHDALPICIRLRGPVDRRATRRGRRPSRRALRRHARAAGAHRQREQDRKSTRLNSSHANISYAVFCLKKKNTHTPPHLYPQVYLTAAPSIV